MIKWIFGFILCFSGLTTHAQLLSVRDLRTCLYPTFAVEDAVLKSKGFLWISSDVSSTSEGEPLTTSVWKTEHDSHGLQWVVSIMKTHVKEKNHITHELVMIKYTVPNSSYATKFRDNMINAGYRYSSSAYNGDSACQSWLSSRHEQILIRANDNESYTFISW